MSAVRRVAFVGFALPDQRFEEVAAGDPGMPIQTQRFGWSVIEALNAAAVETELVSCAPVRDYPQNRQLVVRGQHFRARGSEGHELTFANLTGAKHVSRFAGARRALTRIASTTPVDAVLVHGVNSALIWAAVRFARARDVPCAVIMTDPPALPTRYDNAVTLGLRRGDRRLISAGLRAADGVVGLTAALAADFAPDKPAMVMEGIAVPPTGAGPSGGDGRTVLYAGGLRSEYGVGALLDAARSTRSWALQLYGKGPLEEEARRAAEQHDTISYGGYADASTLAQAYGRAQLLVNPRPTGEEFVRYSFPSKLLEYLASGTPVMTTRLPGLPQDLAEHLWLTGESAAELDAAISDFFGVPGPRRRAVGQAAAEFVLSTRGPEAQGRRIAAFLEGLTR